MSELKFRLAIYSDKAKIIAFMDANWGSKHPLVHIAEYFDYYYSSCSDNNALQFALCEQDDVLIAIAGYILTNKCESPDIWVSIWCAVKGQNGAGLELMNALPSLTHANVMACNNIREKTMPFYTFLGYTAERLPHYYRLADKSVYRVAQIADKNILPVPSGEALCKINSCEQLSNVFTPIQEIKPYKDIWYLSRRYFNYPHQKYDVWGYFKNGKALQLLVTRTVDINGVNVLRIVDYIGKSKDFALLGYGINELMQNANAEYADMYCYGISADIIAKAGLCERKRDDINIIPNYLNPPLYENTEYFFFTSRSDNFMMFKADGDQDRPNINA
ncbi:MAG: hypothetical protein RR508_05660 [Oscillospiraceae bacterium]